MDFSKKAFPIRLIILVVGLFLYAVGISLTIRANIGYAPWDVFHVGISGLSGLTIGTVSILTGVSIVILNAFFKEKIGIGTIANAVLIGFMMDLIMPFIPRGTSYFVGVPMLLGGLFIIGFATVFYIAAGLGSGPRDGLMIVLVKLTKKDIALVRNAMEFTVTVLGYFLGGQVGLGTLLTFLSIGYFVKFAFKITKFDVNPIEHDYLDMNFLKGLMKAVEKV